MANNRFGETSSSSPSDRHGDLHGESYALLISREMLGSASYRAEGSFPSTELASMVDSLLIISMRSRVSDGI